MERGSVLKVQQKREVMVSSWSVKQPTEYQTMTRKDSNRTANEIKTMTAWLRSACLAEARNASRSAM
jgi:hypothetical protein